MTKKKINYKIKKIKNIKREYDNAFWKKVVALAMKILQRNKFVKKQQQINIGNTENIDNDLCILAEYCFNTNNNIKLEEIWYHKFFELLNSKCIQKIYEIQKYPYKRTWYYIITKNSQKYIIGYNHNNKYARNLMMNNKLYTITVNYKVLTIIHDIFRTYDEIPVHERKDNKYIKILMDRNEYCIIEELNSCPKYVVLSGKYKDSKSLNKGIYCFNMIEVEEVCYKSEQIYFNKNM